MAVTMREFERLRFNWHVAALRFEVAAVRHWLLLRKAGFRPDQPRDEDGKWVAEGEDDTSDDGGDAESIELIAQRGGDGHHYIPQSLYKNLDLSPEAREVFDRAKTGRLFDIRSNRYDSDHRAYNDAVKSLFNDFVSENRISPEKMTATEAKAFVNRVLESNDTKIGNFNKTIQMREIMNRVIRRIYRSTD